MDRRIANASPAGQAPSPSLVHFTCRSEYPAFQVSYTGLIEHVPFRIQPEKTEGFVTLTLPNGKTRSVLAIGTQQYTGREFIFKIRPRAPEQREVFQALYAALHSS